MKPNEKSVYQPYKIKTKEGQFWKSQNLGSQTQYNFRYAFPHPEYENTQKHFQRQTHWQTGEEAIATGKHAHLITHTQQKHRRQDSQTTVNTALKRPINLPAGMDKWLNDFDRLFRVKRFLGPELIGLSSWGWKQVSIFRNSQKDCSPVAFQRKHSAAHLRGAFSWRSTHASTGAWHKLQAVRSTTKTPLRSELQSERPSAEEVCVGIIIQWGWKNVRRTWKQDDPHVFKVIIIKYARVCETGTGGIQAGFD